MAEQPVQLVESSRGQRLWNWLRKHSTLLISVAVVASAMAGFVFGQQTARHDLETPSTHVARDWLHFSMDYHDELQPLVAEQTAVQFSSMERFEVWFDGQLLAKAELVKNQVPLAVPQPPRAYAVDVELVSGLYQIKPSDDYQIIVVDARGQGAISLMTSRSSTADGFGQHQVENTAVLFAMQCAALALVVSLGFFLFLVLRGASPSRTR